MNGQEFWKHGDSEKNYNLDGEMQKEKRELFRLPIWGKEQIQEHRGFYVSKIMENRILGGRDVTQ